MSNRRYETWAKEHNYTQVSVDKGELPDTVTLCFSSSADKSCMLPTECVRMFGLAETHRLLQQRGRERWHWNLTKDAAKERVEKWRKRAEKKGYVKLVSP